MAVGHGVGKPELRSAKAVRAAGQRRPGEVAARGVAPQPVAQRQRRVVPAARGTMATTRPAERRAPRRARTWRSRGPGDLAHGPLAASHHRRGRSECRQAGWRQPAAALVRSLQPERSGTRPRTTPRQTRSWICPVDGEPSRCVRPLATPRHTQPVSLTLTSRERCRRQADAANVMAGRLGRGPARNS